jgi:hypothetical protein
MNPRTPKQEESSWDDDDTGSFSHRAKHFWERIPENIRKTLLAQVWCWWCAGGTTIVNFRGTMEGGGLILRGFCSQCGTEVARHIEGD